jgi:hypothetical protein
MNISRIVGFLAAALILPTAYAQKGAVAFPKPRNTNPPPPNVYIVDPPPAPLATYQEPPMHAPAHGKKSVSGKPVLVTPEQAQTIINRFKDAYPKLGSPRLLIFVNREPATQSCTVKGTACTPAMAKACTNSPTGAAACSPVKTAGDKAQPAPADKQMVGDVERLFGRPLRDAGAILTDPKVATQVMGDKPLDAFLGSTDTPEARKDREALGKIADAVIEILVFSKTLTVPSGSATQSITIPDIQATTLSLRDSKIIGQASSSEATSRVLPAELARFGVREITEATALALMQDMTP